MFSVKVDTRQTQLKELERVLDEYKFLIRDLGYRTVTKEFGDAVTNIIKSLYIDQKYNYKKYNRISESWLRVRKNKDPFKFHINTGQMVDSFYAEIEGSTVNVKLPEEEAQKFDVIEKKTHRPIMMDNIGLIRNRVLREYKRRLDRYIK